MIMLGRAANRTVSSQARPTLDGCCHPPQSCVSQTAPGVYDERGLKALDFVLETARKYGLQVSGSSRDSNLTLACQP